MAVVKRIPNQHGITAVSFPRLDGGLNLSETEERLRSNESPELLNLWWEDGCLQSRPGQQEVPVITNCGTAYRPGPGFAATDTPYYGSHFLHMGDKIFRFDGSKDESTQKTALFQVVSGVPVNAGTFFRFGDCLYYKNSGGFFEIKYKPKTRYFSASSVADGAFVPTILVNADPETGAGDLYQPENRLTGKKTVTFTPAKTYDKKERRTGDGTSKIFSIGSRQSKGLASVEVYVDDLELDETEVSVNLVTGYATFDTAPAEGAKIIFKRYKNVAEYHLPVQNVDEICSVKVNDVPMTHNVDYLADLAEGKITFVSAPPASLYAGNSVEITYRKENLDSSGVRAAYKAVMDCCSAAVYGSGNQLCIVLAGCPAQPNAVFWSGNTSVGLDPSYWPMEYYNLVGDTEDPVTGFGSQYGELMVFKARSVGKLALDAVDLDGRTTLSLVYTRVNDRIGCDLPGSIQIVQNNLVFANTSGGLFRVRSSSPAYENNIDCISGKVNGSRIRPGLLSDLAAAGGSTTRYASGLATVRSAEVSALDTGTHYFLNANGHVWAWDYSISTIENPTWWYWTGFEKVRAWFVRDAETYHIDSTGRLTKLAAVYSDYGEPVSRAYQFPVQLFGAYDRLKDVLTAIIALREEDPETTRLIYLTDYEKREDLTPLSVSGSEAISPRDLTYRDLSVNNAPKVFRRRPMCRHVRHFTMRLENDNAEENMAVLYAEIQVQLLGRDR